MTVGASREHGILIARASGRVDGATYRAFQEDLDACIQEDDQHVVLLDLADVEYMSSAGLRVLLLTTRSLARQGKSFAVSGLQPEVREVFHMSGFDRIIPVHDTAGQADMDRPDSRG